MNKIKTFILLIGLSIQCIAQEVDTKTNYQKAFDELNQMLRGDIPLSFKRTVFITENAYLDNQLNYGDFEKQIDVLVGLCEAVATSDGLVYDKEDRQQVLKSASIFKVMKDSLVFASSDKSQIFKKKPYSYDLEDFWGEKDWTKMFVTKLLVAQSGNCHSLPALYKILADELGVKAYLSIVPNHTYIKQWSDKTGWYNTELTNGTFPYDANIKLNSYIKTEAIAAGVYMDTLSAKEDIAYVMTDLVQGYLKKTNHFDIALPLTWLNTVLVNYPDYPNAMILKAELLKEQYAQLMKERGAINFSMLWKDNTMKDKFAELEKSYYQIHQLGYRRMPKEMYLNWLFRVKNDTTRKPYMFTNPQPFKQYNYNVQIVSGGDGQNSEAFDTEEVVRIGTVELNRITGKIVKFIEYNEDEIPDEVISRMYDPALGRFWQIDPVAGKFTGITPYNYCANNPVLLTDPTGADWAIDIVKDKKGNWQVSITFTGAVLNSASDRKNINTTNYIKQQREQFTKIFGGERNGVNVSVNFNVRSIDSKKDLKSNEHLIEIKDRSNFAEDVGGNARLGGKHISMNEKFIGDDGSSIGDVRDVSHEAGHTAGLWHTFEMDDDPSKQRFANGRMGRNDLQQDANDPVSNDYNYANNFMTYTSFAQKRLPSVDEAYLSRNPGKATIGQIWQIWSNYKRGDLNYNDVPK